MNMSALGSAFLYSGVCVAIVIGQAALIVGMAMSFVNDLPILGITFAIGSLLGFVTIIAGAIYYLEH